MSRKGRAKQVQVQERRGPDVRLARRLILLAGVLALPSGLIVWNQAGALAGLAILSGALAFVVFSLRAMGRIERRGR